MIESLPLSNYFLFRANYGLLSSYYLLAAIGYDDALKFLKDRFSIDKVDLFLRLEDLFVFSDILTTSEAKLFMYQIDKNGNSVDVSISPIYDVGSVSLIEESINKTVLTREELNTLTSSAFLTIGNIEPEFIITDEVLKVYS